MKSNEFKKALSAYVDLVEQATSQGHLEAWHMLLPVFDVKPTAKVTEVFKLLKGLDLPTDGSGPLVAGIADLSPYIMGCLKLTGKKAIIDDFGAFAAALAPYANRPASLVAEAVAARLENSVAPKQSPPRATPELLRSYVRRLDEALGDEQGFLEQFNAMKRDRSINASAAKQVAYDFAKKRASTKEQAFGFILDRQLSLLGARPRAAANAGRTAA